MNGPVVMAWDAGLLLGWAAGQDGKILEYGLLDLKQRAEQTGKRPTSVLYSEMRAICKRLGVTAAIRENSVQSFKGADRDRSGDRKFGFAKQIGNHAGYFAILDLIEDALELRQLPHVMPKSLKKFATGDGKADKSRMIRTAQTLYGVDTTDDNVADACHLCMYGLNEIRVAAIRESASR